MCFTRIYNAIFFFAIFMQYHAIESLCDSSLFHTQSTAFAVVRLMISLLCLAKGKCLRLHRTEKGR